MHPRSIWLYLRGGFVSRFSIVMLLVSPCIIMNLLSRLQFTIHYVDINIYIDKENKRLNQESPFVHGSSQILLKRFSSVRRNLGQAPNIPTTI